MLIKFIQKNAEVRFLEAFEERSTHALYVGGILYCAFSKANFKTNPDEVLPLLKDLIRDSEGELYFCDDGDLIVTWRGRIGETARLIIKQFRENFTKELLPFEDKDIFTLYDPQIQGEELRLYLRKKIQIDSEIEIPSGETPSSGPRRPIKLELTEHQKSALQKSLGRRRIRQKNEVLIVEDQDFSRKLLSGLLSKTNQCFEAKNAYEAIHFFAEHAPDIIFLDIELPDQDGHNLASFFKSLDPRSFIIMVTGNNYTKDVQRAKENRVNGFIAKPYSKQMIFNSVDAFSKFKLKRDML